MQTPSFSIYDASAGSGKTYALVKEYLKIILSSKKDDAYRSILAITFTNKAVHEMKSRIVGSLSGFSKDEPDTKSAALMQQLSDETGLSVTDIKRKSRQIIRHIIHNYAAFDISTIDKFTHKVIRAFAHDLNLPMTFEVSLDTENLLIEAVDAIIARAGEDETLTQLLVDFTMEKADDDKSWDIAREILETGRLALNENNREPILHFRDKTIPEFLAIKKKMMMACNQLEDECVDCAHNALALLDRAGIDQKSFSGQYLPKHLHSIRDKKFNPKNKIYRSPEDVKILKGAADTAIIENVLPELLAILACVYNNHEKKRFYTAFLKNITPLSLLNTVSIELNQIQKDQNILSISEFNAIIHNEIQNQPAPFIYERLGERYRHFFIDEFQDTSEMQWQNLIPLIDNALSGQDDSGNKGTLMIVGDPKQSIYRWRGGKAEQFISLSKGDNPFNNPDKQLFSLDRNWRSHAEVVEFNNDFFAFLANEFTNLDYRDLYEHHSRQKTNSKTGGYVHISLLPKAEQSEDDEEMPDKTDMYLSATLNTILKVLREGFRYEEIAVLTRKRGQGIAVANYLSAQNIPLLSSETLMIRNATEVGFIIHLLQYLKNSADLEAKAGFLQYIAQHVQYDLPVHDFIALGMGNVAEADFESWLTTVIGQDHGLLSFQTMRKKSLYEAVEIIISRFLSAEADNAYLQYFLDLVLERDIRSQGGIADFLDFWDKNAHKFSIPSPEGNNAVRILTIHKSKGLEFPVVIMPFADEDYSRKPKDKLWLDADEADFGLPKVLIDNSSAVEGYGGAAALVYNDKKQEELLDNVNVLYVAMTRAVEQLYVISSFYEPKKDGTYPNTTASFFIRFLIDRGLYDPGQHEYSFGNPAKLSAAMIPKAPGVQIKAPVAKLDPRNIRIAQRESIMWGTAQQDAISYGNLVHEILSTVTTRDDAALAVTKAVEAGLITALQQPEMRRVIEDIAGHESLAVYFATGNRILNEQTIIVKGSSSVKPDRMVLTPDNEVYLLDYKTGKHQDKYTKQLQDYESEIQKMGYKVTKKALVYIGEIIEIVHLQ